MNDDESLRDYVIADACVPSQTLHKTLATVQSPGSGAVLAMGQRRLAQRRNYRPCRRCNGGALDTWTQTRYLNPFTADAVKALHFAILV